MNLFFDGYPNILRTNFTEPVAVLEAGLPVGAFKVYETNGTIKTDEELLAYQVLDSEAQKGDLMYVDTNGDNELTSEDKVYKVPTNLTLNTDFNWISIIKISILICSCLGFMGIPFIMGPSNMLMM